MIFEQREIKLKDGRTCILKPTSPEYSSQMIEYLKKTAGETEFLLRYPDEVSFSLEEENALLARFLEDPYCIAMMALVDGKVAGNGTVNGIGNKRKIRHRCSLAIALYEEYWGLGIGSAMIGYLSELASRTGWHQMDLQVVAENRRAISLYGKCGFVETGRNHNALLFDDGTYHDEIIMYKDLR